MKSGPYQTSSVMRRMMKLGKLRVPPSVFVLVAVVASVGSAEEMRFEDVAETAGLHAELRGMMAHAAACGDVDGDGDLDLFVAGFCDRPAEKYKPAMGPVPSKLLIQEDGKFRDFGQPAVSFQARCSGAVFADLDNDGDLDLYVSNNSKSKGLRVANKLYENIGNGKLRDVSKGNGACVIMGGRSIGVLDYDGDGLLDLLVGGDLWTGGQTRLFRNVGRLAFDDVTAKAGLPAELPGLGILTPDFNGDGRPDVLVAQANRLFLSTPGGVFREDTAASKALQYEPLGREDTPCGAAFGDVDCDGDLDLVIVDHNQPARQHLFLNDGVATGHVRFRDVTKAAGLAYLFPEWTPDHRHLKHAHVQIADFDLDGRPDILIAATYNTGRGEQPFICRNLGVKDGCVRFAVPPVAKATNYFAAGPVADYDGDGRPDVMLASWWPEVPGKLLMNRGPKQRWLAVRVVGKTINRMGIGAQVRVYAAGQMGRREALLGFNEVHVSHGFCTGQEAVLHFGLGDAAQCDVEVTLPLGKGVLREAGVAADRFLVMHEP